MHVHWVVVPVLRGHYCACLLEHLVVDLLERRKVQAGMAYKKGEIVLYLHDL